ncbi:pimeloyl-ACP methyl ester carboxylesterase [Chitinophaga niastensis]|uniref:Pimeloyl-ACP methyl ester carboxylesterase n=2 Tax=Chitinophaga niastensis TaxID=536980 RepID=A0A2P8HCI9_CHINA|nr:pimeloyl-ACP methyl ester carboxylesterase [Chitinophaga niastensis]
MRIHIPDEDMEDLYHRLKQSRWPAPVAGSDWADGTDGEYLRDLAGYWLSKYNWRDREAMLNRFGHFTADIEDTQIHFIRAAGQGPNAIPLLLMQGWPSTFVQMLKIIPLLTAQGTDGTPCFDVIVASMPGYPFTRFPSQPGMSFSRIADLLKRLMVEGLGYHRFAARGSDQGALVQQQIGLKYPEHLIGLHRSGITPFATPMPDNLSPAEIAYQKEVQQWATQEIAYARLQSLRPETLAPALADSPIALASWIIEKFQRWGDCEGDVDAHFGRDALLDNISLHWFTGAGAASIRLYREAARDPGMTGRVAVPTAIMMPLRDGVTVPAPREWAERYYNVQRWTVMERGGHFPEWEVPDEIAKDIRQFFAGL